MPQTRIHEQDAANAATVRSLDVHTELLFTDWFGLLGGLAERYSPVALRLVLIAIARMALDPDGPPSNLRLGPERFAAAVAAWEDELPPPFRRRIELVLEPPAPDGS